MPGSRCGVGAGLVSPPPCQGGALGSNPRPRIIFHLVRTKEELELFEEIIRQHHSYVPKLPIVGPSLEYLIEVDGEIAACISLSYFGGRNFPKCFENYLGIKRPYFCKGVLASAPCISRFTIVRNEKNLASQILALFLKRIKVDWKIKTGYRPLVVSTVVHEKYVRGTCFLAAGFQKIGYTKGGITGYASGGKGMFENPLLVLVKPLHKKFRKYIRQIQEEEVTLISKQAMKMLKEMERKLGKHIKFILYDAVKKYYQEMVKLK